MFDSVSDQRERSLGGARVSLTWESEAGDAVKKGADSTADAGVSNLFPLLSRVDPAIMEEPCLSWGIVDALVRW